MGNQIPDMYSTVFLGLSPRLAHLCKTDATIASCLHIFQWGLFNNTLHVLVLQWALNSEYLNSVNIWTANFYLFNIQMVRQSDAWYHGTGYLSSGLVFKWWSEYQSVNQMVIWIPNYHGTGHLKSERFDEQTNLHDLNAKLVCHSDPHCNRMIQSSLVFMVLFLNGWMPFLCCRGLILSQICVTTGWMLR